MFLFVRERKMEGGRERVRKREREVSMSYLGTCPHLGLNQQPRYSKWESNLKHFGIQDNIPTC